MASPPLDDHQQLVAGDDCKAVDGRALTWTSSHFPNVAGATLTLTIGHKQFDIYGNLPIILTGSVPASPANPTAVSFDISGTDTSSLPATQYDYKLTATLVDGDKVTLAIGHLSVQAAPGAPPVFPPPAA